MKNKLIEEKIQKLQSENVVVKNILLSNIKNIDISTYLDELNPKSSSVLGSLIHAKQYVTFADLISKLTLNRDNNLRKAISGLKYAYKLTDAVIE